MMYHHRNQRSRHHHKQRGETPNMDIIDLPLLDGEASPRQALAIMRSRARSAIIIEQPADEFAVLELLPALQGIREKVQLITSLRLERSVTVIDPATIADRAASLLRPQSSALKYESILSSANARFGIISLVPFTQTALVITATEEKTRKVGVGPTTCWCERRSEDHIFGRDEVKPGQLCPDCLLEKGKIVCQ